MRTVVDVTVLIDVGKTLTLRCGATTVVPEANGILTCKGNTASVTMDKLFTLLAEAVKIN